MSYVPIPLERLQFFQTKLGLEAGEMAVLAPHRDAFLAHGDAFAERIQDLLLEIPETRRIVHLMEGRGGLRRNWRCWYDGLFTENFSGRFYQFLWSSGLKHVAASVDQRFIHLAYCVTRGFLGHIIGGEIPADQRARVREVLDKMLDQCLMVATDAFVASTTQCDLEVLNGIAHQVRNPLTVIGGFVQSARRRISSDNPVQPMMDTVLEETRRLEGMVDSVGTYLDIMGRTPEFGACSLEAVIAEALRKLREEGRGESEVELLLAEVGQPLDSDVYLLRLLFRHLLANSMEAAQAAATPVVRVTGSAMGSHPNAFSVEIFNNGRIPRPEEVEHLFTPFYSSRPTSSGFGLPTAALIARKINGELALKPVSGEGTYTTITLPLRRAG